MQQIEEVKRGQVVCYRTNGVYTYGLVLGVSDKEFQKMSDVETKSLRSIKAGIYYLCNYLYFLLYVAIVYFIIHTQRATEI